MDIIIIVISTDQIIQLVIDGHDNKKQDIKTGILQRLLVSFILLLIYISRVFNKVIEANLAIIFLFFVDNLGFITIGSSVKNLAKSLRQVA